MMDSKKSDGDEKPEYLKEEPSPFVAFSNMVDARQFQVNIENYNEIDFFKHENDMRKVLQGLIEPVMKQQANDRETFVTFEHKINLLTNSVHSLQDIVYDRDKVTGRMALFDRIFEEIKNVDNQRIIKEQDIIKEQRLLQQNIQQLQIEQEQQRKQLINFDGILKQLNKDLVEQQQRQQEWQNKFLQSYDENQGKLIAEISQNRAKHSESELRLLKIDQKIQFIEEFVLKSQGSLKNFEERLQAQQVQINDCQYEKQGKVGFKEEVRRIEKNIYDLRYDSENHANHFAMVENFVEKYIPVRIQSQISETLQCLLPKRQLQELEIFEKEKFKDLHQIILDDDGTPDLFKSLREIRMDIGNFDFANYKGIHVQRRRQALEATGQSVNDNDSLHSGSEDSVIIDDNTEDIEQTKDFKRNSSNQIRAKDNNDQQNTQNNDGKNDARLQPSLRRTRAKQPLEDQKDERTILNEQQDKLIDDKIKKKAGMKLVKSEKKAKAIFKRKLQGLGFDNKNEDPGTGKDQQADTSQQIEEEAIESQDEALNLESERPKSQPKAQRKDAQSNGEKSEQKADSTNAKPSSTPAHNKRSQVSTHLQRSSKHHVEKNQVSVTAGQDQNGGTVNNVPMIHSKYLNTGDGINSSIHQPSIQQIVQYIQRLEGTIKNHGDQIEQLDKYEKSLRLDLKEQNNLLKTQINKTSQQSMSQIRELNEYIQNLHKEVTIFVDKKKNESQNYFVQLEASVKEISHLKKYVQSDIKQQQDQMALLISCILEMLKLGREDYLDGMQTQRRIPTKVIQQSDQANDKDGQMGIQYKQLKTSQFNSTNGSNFNVNQNVPVNKMNASQSQVGFKKGNVKVNDMSFSGSRKSNSIKHQNSNSNSMRNIAKQKNEQESSIFPNPYQQNYLNPLQRPYGSIQNSRNSHLLPHQRSHENINMPNISNINPNLAKTMATSGGKNFDIFNKEGFKKIDGIDTKHVQSSFKINFKNDKQFILKGDNNNFMSNNDINYKGAEITNETNQSRISKMQPVGFNHTGSDRRTETPGIQHDEDNFLSFGDTGAFDKQKNKKYQFGSSKQALRGKNNQLNDLSNSRKERINQTNRTHLTFLQTGSSFNPLSQNREIKIFSKEYTHLIFQILIDKCLEVISNSQLFKSNNLNSNRIIKDIRDYLKKLGITPQQTRLDHFIITPNEDGQQIMSRNHFNYPSTFYQGGQHHTLLIDRLRNFTRYCTPGAEPDELSPSRPDTLSKREVSNALGGMSGGYIQIEPFMGMSTPEIEDSMLRDDQNNQTPKVMHQNEGDEDIAVERMRMTGGRGINIDEGYRGFGGVAAKGQGQASTTDGYAQSGRQDSSQIKKSVSTSPLLFGGESSGGLGKKYAGNDVGLVRDSGSNMQQNENQQHREVQTKRIEDSSIDKEDYQKSHLSQQLDNHSFQALNQSQVKSLMSRVGEKHRLGGVEGAITDKDISENKLQNSDLRDLDVRTNKRFIDDSNTDDITKTQDMDHQKNRVGDDTPNKRKINLSMASKQNVTLMKINSKKQIEQSQNTNSNDDQIIQNSMHTSVNYGLKNQFNSQNSYKSQNLNM